MRSEPACPLQAFVHIDRVTIGLGPSTVSEKGIKAIEMSGFRAELGAPTCLCLGTR